MSIIKEILLDSGITVTFHKIGRVTFTNSLSGVRASVLVSSWISQSQYDSGASEVHTEAIQDLSIEISTDIFASVEAHLITSDTSKYYNGTPVVDTIIVPLDALKAARWNLIRSIRDKVEKSTFTWNGTHVFDSDDSSQIKLTLAAIKAVRAIQSNEEYTEYWTLANNNVIPLTAPEVVEVVEALGDHIRSTHVTGTILRMSIDAATTEEEVLAVTWPV